MTEEKLIAAAVIRDHAQDIEFLDVVEMLGDFDPDECREVHDLITRARITVSWEDS